MVVCKGKCLWINQLLILTNNTLMNWSYIFIKKNSKGFYKSLSLHVFTEHSFLCISFVHKHIASTCIKVRNYDRSIGGYQFHIWHLLPNSSIRVIIRTYILIFKVHSSYDYIIHVYMWYQVYHNMGKPITAGQLDNINDIRSRNSADMSNVRLWEIDNPDIQYSLPHIIA